MSKRSTRLLINDILCRIDLIEDYITGLSYDIVFNTPQTVDAVIRCLEVIGEAARHVPEAFVKAHSDIPWRKIIGLRNRIIHEYFNVDPDVIWKIVQDELPILKKQLEPLFKALEAQDTAEKQEQS